jgi:hypothetical protein
LPTSNEVKNVPVTQGTILGNPVGNSLEITFESTFKIKVEIKYGIILSSPQDRPAEL